LYGLCLLQLDKLPESIKQLEVVHKALPDDLGASYGLALAYIAAGKTDQASTVAQRVFYNLDSAEAHLVLGSLAAANRDFKKATEELTKAKTLNPQLPTVHTRLGAAYLMAGDRDASIKEFEAEIAVNPNDFEANARLGWMYREDGRLDEAGVRLAKALDLRPDDPGTLYHLGQLAQAKGQVEEAVKLLERVTTLAPDFTAAHVLLARLYYKVKRPADAERERAIVERLNAEQQKREPGEKAVPDGVEPPTPGPQGTVSPP
jgi:tetratricopeptide (TPR) repeat protein